MVEDTQLSLKQLSEEYGISREAVRARMFRRGLNATRETEQELRAVVATMKPREAIAFLLDCIEVLTSVDDAPRVHDGMTLLESRIMNRLLLSEGDVVTRDQLMTAMYFERLPQDWPGAKIADVKVCTLRKKLPANNIIETVWGVGYRLVRG